MPKKLQRIARQAAAVVVLLAAHGSAATTGAAVETPWTPPVIVAHPRPYFMPAGERARILKLVRSAKWAQADHARLSALAEDGDGFHAAFLYALHRQPGHLDTARSWLLDLAAQGGDLGYLTRKAGPDFFDQGQPWLGGVYYAVDMGPLVAFDWIYTGLSATDRDTIAQGILESAQFRRHAMDRWTQTPNLVFKPTTMVAAAGLATGDATLTDWGFYRHPRSNLGGYFPVLNHMLRDGGPWAEAPLYPLTHRALEMMVRMSRLLGLATGHDWFRTVAPKGGSPGGLFEYYLSTAYPVELLAGGHRQIRLVSYGDGATGPGGDIFLVSPDTEQPSLNDLLPLVYQLSGDPRHGALLRLLQDYRPGLLERPPPPDGAALPPAPSSVWPDFGLVMLRSDETPAYWTSPESIAVSQLTARPYGHQHHDQFSITLFGASRLLYPDYNPVQYQNPAAGWTQSTLAHNTVMVDDGDGSPVDSVALHHLFEPEVKISVTVASDVYPGIRQQRSLFLTTDYLLDLFHLASDVPHTYSYLLHSFGRAVPAAGIELTPAPSYGARFRQVSNLRGIRQDTAWTSDFILDAERNRRRRDTLRANKRKAPDALYGDDWLRRAAAVRVRLAAGPRSWFALGEDAYGLDLLSVRRTARSTLFAATHEPYVPGTEPQIEAVTVLAESAQAAVVRIDAVRFTDYAAVSFATERDPGALADPHDPDTRFRFGTAAFLRIHDDGRITARGDWTGIQIPFTGRPATLPAQWQSAATGYLRFGNAEPVPPSSAQITPETPLVIAVPDTVPVFDHASQIATVTLQNRAPTEVSGELVFEHPALSVIDPPSHRLAPGESARQSIGIDAPSLGPGLHSVPYRTRLTSSSDNARVVSEALALRIAVGPVLERLHRFPEPSIYRVFTPLYSAAADMANGSIRALDDRAGTPLLEDGPLFTLGDGQETLMHPRTTHAFTWVWPAPARLQAAAMDRIRWQADFLNDRIRFELDRNMTRVPLTVVDIPGGWAPERGDALWRTVVDPDGVSRNAGAEARIEVAAGAELGFSVGDTHLCFGFNPPRTIQINGGRLRFDVDSMSGDRWSIGFCAPDGLRDWLNG